MSKARIMDPELGDWLHETGRAVARAADGELPSADDAAAMIGAARPAPATSAAAAAPGASVMLRWVTVAHRPHMLACQRSIISQRNRGVFDRKSKASKRG
eukprot:COSAG04_NODE_5914_length_1457_cov_1.709867_2_plen_100_part_00